MKKAIVIEENMDQAAYLTRDRGYGEGEVRINTFIELNEDIYSLGFATQLNDEIMTLYFDVLNGELKNLGGHDSSSDSDSDSGDEKKIKKKSSPKNMIVSLNGGRSPKSKVAEVDSYTQEIEEKKQFLKDQRNFEIRKQKRLNILVHVFLTFLFQFTLVVLVFFEIFFNCQYSYNIISLTNTAMLFGRFICASILHMSLIDEVSAGLEYMKYSVNHPYMFQHFGWPWVIGAM